MQSAALYPGYSQFFYKAYIWHYTHEKFSDIPWPASHGWRLETIMEYEETSGLIVPHEPVDIICTKPDIEPADEEDLSTEVDKILDIEYEDDTDDDGSA